MADEVYYIRFRGQTTGPFNRDMMLSKARSGLISKVHSISTDSKTWVMAKSMDWLFAVPAVIEMPTPPPPAPPPMPENRPFSLPPISDNEPIFAPETKRNQSADGTAQPPSPGLARQMPYTPEFRLAPYRPIRPVTGIWFILGSIIFFIAAAFFFNYSIMRRISGSPGSETAGELLFWIFIMVGFGTMLYGDIHHQISMYLAWKHIIHWNRTTGRLTTVSSPVAAIGLGFIPVFGTFYWVFKLYGIGNDINILIDNRIVRSERISTIISTIFCICLFISTIFITVISIILVFSGLPREGVAAWGILTFLSGSVGITLMIIYCSRLGQALDDCAKVLGGVE